MKKTQGQGRAIFLRERKDETVDDPLFPGFETGRFQSDGAEIYYRSSGDGPPLLLLHGFPQTGAMWAAIAPALSTEFHVVAPDLRGYGRSTGPAEGGAAAYSKRVMATEMVALMSSLGHEAFAMAGHDRGARVGYRLALDHPKRLTRLAVLDILPTYEYWARIDRDFALKIYHWAWLAQPYPFPETMVGAAPDFFIEDQLARLAGAGGLSAFAPAALEEYKVNAREPARLRSMCDDYRAGASIDVEHDAADKAEGRKISIPLLALWGGVGLAQDAGKQSAGAAPNPLDVWRGWSEHVEGGPIECGHYLPEEQPEATLEALFAFFRP